MQQFLFRLCAFMASQEHRTESNDHTNLLTPISVHFEHRWKERHPNGSKAENDTSSVKGERERQNKG